LYHKQQKASKTQGAVPPMVPEIANMTGYMKYISILT
jgi:hypothetical protein